MSKKTMRLWSWLLVFVMIFNMLPMNAMAVDTGQNDNSDTVPRTNDDAYIIEEVVANRTEYTKEFVMSNGLHMAAVYDNAVHYQENGQWEEIDNTLKLASTRSGNVYTNTSGSWQVSFPQSLTGNNGITISKDEYTLSFRMSGELHKASDGTVLMNTDENVESASESDIGILETLGTEENLSLSQPAVSTDAVIHTDDQSDVYADAQYEETVVDTLHAKLEYADVYNNTDIIYELNSNLVKESVVINQFDATLYGYTYLLDVGEMVPVLNDNGEIELYDASHENVVMLMPAPYLVDNAGEYNYDVQIMLDEMDGTYVLTYLLPRDWISDENREWPVVLDPIVCATATSGNTRDQAVYSDTYLSYTKGVIQCGNYGSWGVGRIYLKYNELPVLSSSDVIVSANVTLYTSTTSIEAARIVEVHKVTDTWASETITWDNKPDPVDTVEDYQICQTTETYYTWDITDIARGWYDGENTGMMFKVDDASEASTSNTRVQFYSSDYGVLYKPTVLIMFRNNNGLEGYWDYTASATTRAGTGYVNQYTGNLVWIHEDMGFGGNRMPVTINHVYNANDSEQNVFGLGYGWRTNYNQEVYRWEYDNAATDYYIWEDGDGTKHYFYKDKDSTGKYLDEDGMELTLTDTDVEFGKYCISDKYGNCSYFDDNGRLIRQSNYQEITSSIVIEYTSESEDSKRIASIKDGAGRMYYFTYANDLLSRIDYKGTNKNTVLRTVTYSYTDSELIEIGYMDGKYASFDYVDTSETNTKRLLKSVTDIDGYTLEYEYTRKKDGIPARIQSITEKDGEVCGGKLSFQYARNQTTITDSQKNLQRIQFNTWGNTISVQDGQGRAQYAGYAIDNPTDTTKGNQLTLSSQMQNTVGNRTKNSDFDLDGTWSTSATTISNQIVTGTAYSGNRSLKVTTTADAVNPYLYAGSYEVSANSSVTFSAYIKTGEAPTYLSINDGTTTVRSEILEANSDWTRLQVTYHNNTDDSKSVTLRIPMKGTGISYVDCVQLENAASSSRFNLVGNGDFRFANAYWSSDSGRTTLSPKAAPELSTNVYKMTGSPTAKRRISQTIPISGASGDNFVLAGWAKAHSVQLRDDRKFGIIATFNLTDGSKEAIEIHFNPSVENWQYVCDAVVAPGAYESITITLAYDYNANTAYFDGIQLYKEGFGTSYTYDENGNVVISTDMQQQETKCTYNKNQDLTSIEMPSGESVTYTYDSYHNVETATTGTGVVYTYDYDPYGNNISVTISDGVSGNSVIAASAAYTTGGNRMTSSTDALGQTTTYSYTANTNVLDYVLYPNDTSDTKTDYSYDSMFRMLTGVTTTTDTGLTLSASYEYTDDLLTKLSTPSTDYTFTYGNFGLRTKVKAGGVTLATYTYEDVTNYLKKLAYGNGDSVEYTYNTQGQLLTQTYEDGDVLTYRYGNSGELASVTDSGSGITQHYIYDLIGRPGQYRETGGEWEVIQTYTYNKKNQMTKVKETIGDRTCTTVASYDSEGRVKTYRKNYSRVTYAYDGLDRVSSMTTCHTYTDKDILTESYSYCARIVDDVSYTSGRVRTFTTKSIGDYDVTYSYEYDNNGNITSVSDGTNETKYVYDTANQLVRENNEAAGKTWVYTYDNAGNILTKNEYAYTTGTVGTATETVTYGYTHETWGDLLKTYDGSVLYYDGCGNLVNGPGWRYTWEHGRQLATMTTKDGTTTWNFTYNADGLRTSRTNGTTTYKYQYLGGQLVKMTVGDNVMYFNYDASGVPVSIVYNATTYYYVTNLQGDVVGIVNQSGNQIVGYTYDAWGNILTTTGSSANTLGKHNPLRYRGYVYDTESTLYYLQSRYYDPEMGRFISADDTAYLGADGTPLSYNLFAYCKNNPVMLSDPNGYAPEWWHWAISGAMVVAGVALVATGVGGVAGGTLICAGANSMIGSYVSEATGGSSVAGWVGGMITGAACGTGAGLAGNLLVQATNATGAACLGNLAAGGAVALGSGTVGSAIGQGVSAAIDGKKLNSNEVAYASMATGAINCLSGLGAGVGTALQGMPAISTTTTTLANSLNAAWSLVSESVCDFLGTISSFLPW